MDDGPSPQETAWEGILMEVARIKKHVEIFERADMLRVENALARIDQRLERIERMIAFLPLPPEQPG